MFEIRPCRETAPGVIENVEPAKAQFWTVYEEQPDNAVGTRWVAIADCPNEEIATRIKRALELYTILAPALGKWKQANGN